MKTLHLLRHAKSSWQDSALDDHDRDLNERGRRDAPAMGHALSAILTPQLIYVSSALRAQRTLEGLCDGWPSMRSLPHITDNDLYTFSWEDVLAWLQALRGTSESCFLIGHNPGLTELCNQLCGRRVLDNLPTAGYLRLSLPFQHWKDLEVGAGELETHLFPRSLP